MSVAALEAKRKRLVDEAAALIQKEDRTDDELARANAIADEAGELAEQIKTERRLEALAGEQAQYTERARDPRGAQRAADGAEANDGANAQSVASIGRRFVQSEEYKAARRARMNDTAPVHIGGLLPVRSADAPEQRSLIYSGTAPADALRPQLLPEIYRGLDLPLMMRDVLLNLPTQSDAIIAMVESGYTNNAAAVPEATATTSTGYSNAAKPESALTFTQNTFPVATIAHWVPITRQTLDDLPMMEAYVNERLLRGLAVVENSQFLNGDGTGANLTGILNTSGIQVLDAAYFSGDPVQNAGVGNENYERILRAKIQVMVTGQARPSFVVMNPSDIEGIITAANTTGNYLFPGLTNGDLNGQIAGLRVVWDTTMTAGTALVGDGTMAAVADRMAGQIFTTDSHSDYFTHNLFVILAEERVGLPVFRPAAFAVVTLA